VLQLAAGCRQATKPLQYKAMKLAGIDLSQARYANTCTSKKAGSQRILMNVEEHVIWIKIKPAKAF
jgi:hypothetical protein